tara:strand:- start:337 stop:726 length:390 start_codon:yes stop_codon:yes gene_type:complete
LELDGVDPGFARISAWFSSFPVGRFCELHCSSAAGDTSVIGETCNGTGACNLKMEGESCGLNGAFLPVCFRNGQEAKRPTTRIDTKKIAFFFCMLMTKALEMKKAPLTNAFPSLAQSLEDNNIGRKPQG